ncbi:MAG: hypothetical protein AAF289_06355 [Cyanobacteria bacterium P01_A01_bin.135]
MSIPVQGGWRACSLAIPAFSAWHEWELVMETSPIDAETLASYALALPPLREMPVCSGSSE